MAKPNKKRGFRAITIDSNIFNWCFQGVIDVRPDDYRNNKLFIDFGWYDEWSYVNDKENKPPPYEPIIVKPQFVSESIKAAIKLGWNPRTKSGQYILKYRNKKYTLLDQ